MDFDDPSAGFYPGKSSQRQDTSTPAPTRDDYRQFLSTMARRGQYLPLPTRLMGILGLVPAAMLVKCLATLGYRADGEGWAMATQGFLSAGLGISEARVDAALAKLEERGIVRTKYRRGDLWVSVDLDKLAAVLEADE